MGPAKLPCYIKEGFVITNLFITRFHNIALMSMYMTDTFCSFTRNVTFQSCFLLSWYGRTQIRERIKGNDSCFLFKWSSEHTSLCNNASSMSNTSKECWNYHLLKSNPHEAFQEFERYTTLLYGPVHKGANHGLKAVSDRDSDPLPIWKPDFTHCEHKALSNQAFEMRKTGALDHDPPRKPGFWGLVNTKLFRNVMRRSCSWTGRWLQCLWTHIVQITNTIRKPIVIRNGFRSFRNVIRSFVNRPYVGCKFQNVNKICDTVIVDTYYLQKTKPLLICKNLERTDSKVL